MNFGFAREVGLLRYITRRIWWRVAPPRRIRLHTGVDFPLPREKAFASDVYVTEGNLDWNAEFILAAYLKQKTPRGDFLDVGAHIGYYAALLSPFVDRIYAFEPDARNHPYLRKTMEGLARAEIVNLAVCDTECQMAFADDEESSVSHLVPEADDRAATMVQTTSIDHFVAARKARPVAVKVDIEGYDILALRGSLHTCREHQPVFLVEYYQEAGKPNTWEALNHFLEDAGYSLYAISSEPRVGVAGYRYTFQKRTAEEMPRLNTKMLFLVPPSAGSWFEAFAKKNPSWSSDALRPREVQRFLASASSPSSP